MDVEEYGPKYWSTRHENDIESIHDSSDGLTIVIDTFDKNGEEKKLKVFFHLSLAYRYLDETDLAYYWESGSFYSHYHVYKINSGGWSNGEATQKGVMEWSRGCNRAEWFIATTNGCINVLSEQEPIIEWLSV
jgi:hypothetical protein